MIHSAIHKCHATIIAPPQVPPCPLLMNVIALYMPSLLTLQPRHPTRRSSPYLTCKSSSPLCLVHDTAGLFTLLFHLTSFGFTYVHSTCVDSSSSSSTSYCCLSFYPPLTPLTSAHLPLASRLHPPRPSRPPVLPFLLFLFLLLQRLLITIVFLLLLLQLLLIFSSGLLSILSSSAPHPVPIPLVVRLPFSCTNLFVSLLLLRLLFFLLETLLIFLSRLLLFLFLLLLFLVKNTVFDNNSRQPHGKQWSGKHQHFNTNDIQRTLRKGESSVKYELYCDFHLSNTV